MIVPRSKLETNEVRTTNARLFKSDRDEKADMSLIADDFAEFVPDGDDDDRPLGDALASLAIDIDLDSVEVVRDLRERP
ncbi:hypothetical protein D3261_18075 [Halococcus sp. IIIV-5B]|nr:hypothetical protein D3261_18075 [Halococcus sp. IIIV-5B]